MCKKTSRSAAVLAALMGSAVALVGPAGADEGSITAQPSGAEAAAGQPAPEAQATSAKPEAAKGPVVIVRRVPGPPPERSDGLQRDPTLISVPSNTLGPGMPYWLQREREDAEARIARATAARAEADAQRARAEADLWAGDRNRGGVVIYGPHRPGVWRRLHTRPLGAPIEADQLGEDPFERAQRRFGETAYPRTGAIIEQQQEAQRRFGENARPPVSELQRQRDQDVIRSRREAPPPE